MSSRAALEGLTDRRPKTAAAMLFTGPAPVISPWSHASNSFLGCFSLLRRDQLNEPLFHRWKSDPRSLPAVTAGMADDLARMARPNLWHAVTTAPASATRDPSNYCADRLARAAAERLAVQFVRCFEQRRTKRRHGRFESLAQEPPVLRYEAIEQVRGRVVLVVDDVLTTGQTMRRCFLALRELGCHVDGLVWLYWSTSTRAAARATRSKFSFLEAGR